MLKRFTTYGPGGFDPTKPNNNIIEEYDEDTAPVPLDPTGALATLLAVVGTLTVEDAATAVGLTPDDLVTEAQAWAAAGDAG
jgi:hypothetical protein